MQSAIRNLSITSFFGYHIFMASTMTAFYGLVSVNDIIFGIIMNKMKIFIEKTT